MFQNKCFSKVKIFSLHQFDIVIELLDLFFLSWLDINLFLKSLCSLLVDLKGGTREELEDGELLDVG